MPPAEPTLVIDDNATGHKRKKRKDKDINHDSDPVEDIGDVSELSKPNLKKRKKRAHEADDDVRKDADAVVTDSYIANSVDGDGEATKPTRPKKKKSKKRERELDGADGGHDATHNDFVVDEDTAQPRKKRRKKKDRDSQRCGEESGLDAGVAEAVPYTVPHMAVPVHSNEEILHMLQSVDISKVDLNAVFSSMKASSTTPLPAPVLTPGELRAISPPVRKKTRRQTKPRSKSPLQEPVASSSSSSSRSVSRPPASGPIPPTRNENTAEHAHTIATKWMSSAQLQNLVDTEGGSVNHRWRR